MIRVSISVFFVCENRSSFVVKTWKTVSVMNAFALSLYSHIHTHTHICLSFILYVDFLLRSVSIDHFIWINNSLMIRIFTHFDYLSKNLNEKILFVCEKDLMLVSRAIILFTSFEACALLEFYQFAHLSLLPLVICIDSTQTSVHFLRELVIGNIFCRESDVERIDIFSVLHSASFEFHDDDWLD